MLLIKFSTAVDAYQKQCWPRLSEVPRIGDTVEVTADFKSYFSSKRLPTSMRVVNVTWKEDNIVLCELWYDKTDLEIAKMSDINLFP